MKLLKLVAIICLMALPARAELIAKASPHSVAITVDRLVAAVEGAGATVVARVNHGAAAESVDMPLRPTEMLMFGNPRLGTPAMQAAQVAGLDLPLRVVVWEDEEGVVTLAYRNPMELVEYGLAPDAEVLSKMAGALDNLTGAAIAE